MKLKLITFTVLTIDVYTSLNTKPTHYTTTWRRRDFGRNIGGATEIVWYDPENYEGGNETKEWYQARDVETGEYPYYSLYYDSKGNTLRVRICITLY